MDHTKLELFETAGNFLEELENANLENIYGAAAEPRYLSEDNDGNHCTVTWECSICPTHTCWC